MILNDTRISNLMVLEDISYFVNG